MLSVEPGAACLNQMWCTTPIRRQPTARQWKISSRELKGADIGCWNTVPGNRVVGLTKATAWDTLIGD
jgi:hypothetical protein